MYYVSPTQSSENLRVLTGLNQYKMNLSLITGCSHLSCKMHIFYLLCCTLLYRHHTVLSGTSQDTAFFERRCKILLSADRSCLMVGLVLRSSRNVYPNIFKWLIDKEINTIDYVEKAYFQPWLSFRVEQYLNRGSGFGRPFIQAGLGSFPSCFQTEIDSCFTAVSV